MISELDKILDIDETAIISYARLWQFERWLREMVYVELKAKKGKNWFNLKKTSDPFYADQLFTHMPSTSEGPLSYTTFPELIKIVNNNWELFSSYLPPQDIWNVKIDEVNLIRNRVAHFRKGHSDDLTRILLLLRDVDKGFWHFCTDYNDLHPILPPEKDVVTNKYNELDPFSFKETAPNEWAQFGIAPQDLRYIVTIRTTKRRWAEKSSVIDNAPGYIYYINIHLRDERQFNYRKFLESTKKFSPELIHIILSQSHNQVQVTIPAVIGSEKVCNLIDCLIEITNNTIYYGNKISREDRTAQRLSEDWPEYVIGPENPLSYLDPDMSCSFFNVSINK